METSDHKLDHYKPWTCLGCKGADYADLLAVERGNGTAPVEYGTTVTVPGHAVAVEDLPSTVKTEALALTGAGWTVKAQEAKTVKTQPPFGPTAQKAGQPRPDKVDSWWWLGCQKGPARATLTFSGGALLKSGGVSSGFVDAVIEDPITGRAVCKVKADFVQWYTIF